MENRDLIRDAMMFAVKDTIGRVLREADVQSMIDDFEKELHSEQLCECESHTFYEWEKSENKCIDCGKKIY